MFRITWSSCNLAGVSAALLPRCLSNFKTMRSFKLPISLLQIFTRSYDKTSWYILKRAPVCCSPVYSYHTVCSTMHIIIPSLPTQCIYWTRQHEHSTPPCQIPRLLHGMVCPWYKIRLALSPDLNICWGLLTCIELQVIYNAPWAHVSDGNFHRFQGPLMVPLHSPDGRKIMFS